MAVVERVDGEWQTGVVWVHGRQSQRSLFMAHFYGKGILSKNGVLGVTDSLNERPATRSIGQFEILQLAAEEALYLQTRKKWLCVRDSAGPVSDCRLWEMCCAAYPAFPARFAVYAQYRDRGWVVRSGLKYGVEFVLYRRGPFYEHADFCVAVSGPGASTENITWQLVQNLSRLSTLIAKGLILCYVEMAPIAAACSTGEGEGTERGEDRESVKSVASFLAQVVVRECNVVRWVPEKEREPEEEPRPKRLRQTRT